MDFKKIAIIVTLAVIATGLIASCSSSIDDDNKNQQFTSHPVTSSATSPSVTHQSNDNFNDSFLGSLLGTWLGNNINNNSNYQYDNKQIPSTTVPSNNQTTNSNTQNNVKDIQPPSSQQERPKQSVSDSKRITENKPASGKTGIGNGGARGVVKSAVS